jgi:hypothetical protein
MQFFHTIANWHGVIRPGWNEIDPVTHTPVRHRPLEVQFRRHRFDTELAKRSLGWSDDEHAQVVQALLNPPEGHPFWTDRNTGRLNVDLEAHPAEVNYGPNGPQGVPAKPCGFLLVTGTGSVFCGRPSEPGDDFCAEHRATVNRQVSVAKARDAKAAKEPEEVSA